VTDTNSPLINVGKCSEIHITTFILMFGKTTSGTYQILIINSNCSTETNSTVKVFSASTSCTTSGAQFNSLSVVFSLTCSADDLLKYVVISSGAGIPALALVVALNSWL